MVVRIAKLGRIRPHNAGYTGLPEWRVVAAVEMAKGSLDAEIERWEGEEGRPISRRVIGSDFPGRR